MYVPICSNDCFHFYNFKLSLTIHVTAVTDGLGPLPYIRFHASVVKTRVLTPQSRWEYWVFLTALNIVHSLFPSRQISELSLIIHLLTRTIHLLTRTIHLPTRTVHFIVNKENVYYDDFFWIENCCMKVCIKHSFWTRKHEKYFVCHGEKEQIPHRANRFALAANIRSRWNLLLSHLGRQNTILYEWGKGFSLGREKSFYIPSKVKPIYRSSST